MLLFRVSLVVRFPGGFMVHGAYGRRLIDRVSTSIRLASVDEVLSAKAYLCFVSGV